MLTFPTFEMKSLAIKFPVSYIRNKRMAREFSQNQNQVNLLYYGDIGIVVFDHRIFSDCCMLSQQIILLLNNLISIGILDSGIEPKTLLIHRIEFNFQFDHCSTPFFCKIEGFRHVNDNFLSRDFREKGVKTGEGYKNKQRSLLCYTTNTITNSSSLSFILSGKYASYITFQHLNYSLAELPYIFQGLLSIIITQATDPTHFIINRTIFPFFDDVFKSIFYEAGWFSEQFVKQRVTKNKWGVPDSYYLKEIPNDLGNNY